ncbi:4-hydroxy-tetrahydrodipicolinate reductase [Leuconostocaceae bacterium ESL0723]|nr:4-hydroxy-tetrahydrodipicolinate reductase [Leuconostocaceae bacterium ESL0723]
MLKVVLAGFTGAMGQQAVKLIEHMDGVQLVAVVAPSAQDKDPKSYGLDASVAVYDQTDQVDTPADVWLDFTLPDAVYQNAKFAIEHDMRPLIGTTGLTDDQVAELKQLAQEHHLGGLIVPNFGLSAVLLMKFAQEAAAYFPDVEIIELHHADKKDAPSGTALNTAKLISKVRPPHEQSSPDSKETLPGARGGDYEGIRIHAVRLPGYVAHEEVLFGGPGEALTIRQDSFDRASFMKGVQVALTKISDLDQLVVGLENVL